MNRRIVSKEPLTLEKLRELREQLKKAPTACPGCPHPAHRAYRCQIKWNGTRACDCNITFELTSS